MHDGPRRDGGARYFDLGRLSRIHCVLLLSPTVTLRQIGPFIDESHPEIVAGRIPCSFEQLFADKIATRLYSFVRAHPKSQVLLVPSTKDVLHSYQVFPQPPLDKTGLFRELRQAFRKDCPFVDQVGGRREELVCVYVHISMLTTCYLLRSKYSAYRTRVCL